MAHKQTSHSIDSNKHTLKAELERARSNMSRNFAYVRYRGAIKSRMKDSVRQHAGWWAGGAVVLGTIVGWKLLRPRKEESKKFKYQNMYSNPGNFFSSKKQKMQEGEKKGILLGLLGFSLSILQPAIVRLLSKKVSAWVQDQDF